MERGTAPSTCGRPAPPVAAPPVRWRTHPPALARCAPVGGHHHSLPAMTAVPPRGRGSHWEPLQMRGELRRPFRRRIRRARKRTPSLPQRDLPQLPIRRRLHRYWSVTRLLPRSSLCASCRDRNRSPMTSRDGIRRQWAAVRRGGLPHEPYGFARAGCAQGVSATKRGTPHTSVRPRWPGTCRPDRSR